jgi:hypothetical protein
LEKVAFRQFNSHSRPNPAFIDCEGGFRGNYPPVIVYAYRFVSFFPSPPPLRKPPSRVPTPILSHAAPLGFRAAPAAAHPGPGSGASRLQRLIWASPAASSRSPPLSSPLAARGSSGVRARSALPGGARAARGSRRRVQGPEGRAARRRGLVPAPQQRNAAQVLLLSQQKVN